jgi:hypothetical protein
MTLEENNNERKIDERIKKVVPEILRSSAFSDRKITDTPTDDLAVVSRKYVTLNGPSSTRPTSSIVGQFYYDTTIGRPIWWDGTSFKNAVGSVT